MLYCKLIDAWNPCPIAIQMEYQFGTQINLRVTHQIPTKRPYMFQKFSFHSLTRTRRIAFPTLRQENDKVCNSSKLCMAMLCTHRAHGKQEDQMQRSGDLMQSCMLFRACLDLEGSLCVSWEAALQMQVGTCFMLAAHACHSAYLHIYLTVLALKIEH